MACTSAAGDGSAGLWRRSAGLGSGGEGYLPAHDGASPAPRSGTQQITVSGENPEGRGERLGDAEVRGAATRRGWEAILEGRRDRRDAFHAIGATPRAARWKRPARATCYGGWRLRGPKPLPLR